ncbi:MULTISPECIES: threonine/serine exporter family protein [Clostridium]|uniref:Threonine/serine exporter family protein n=1 Tax=Clostridium cibarium TaxID=2762247 RepID=A0ABR8PPR9_9CLOT|nr:MULTISPECIES: threonine/serine exporter family protein [Clostridium]MBD7910167.1 threonine/serine exporter family protein [Clostridium cibarium]
MIIETLTAIIASIGFGIIFNIKGKKLLFASLGGGLSWFFYSLGLELGFSDIFSLFISSICFSIYSEIFARLLKTPVTTLVICCLIPLVPGAGMYNTMYEVITGNITRALELAINTLSSAGTLVLGIIFVSTITRQLKVIKKIKRK